MTNNGGAPAIAADAKAGEARARVCDALPPYCERCHAHIVPMGCAELAWSWICWQLVMVWPDRFFMSRPHAWLLPWAGNIAFRCSCRANNGCRRR